MKSMKQMIHRFSTPLETKQELSEEQEATLELVELGLKLADRGISISAATIHAWMQGPRDAPFPQPDTFE